MYKYSEFPEDWVNLIDNANAFSEVSIIFGSMAWMLLKRTFGNSAPESEAVVELQRDLGMLKERCRLQENINSINEELIPLIQQKNTQKCPEIKLLEIQLQQYQNDLDNLIGRDCIDGSSTDIFDLQKSLDAQLSHFKGLLEIANNQSQYFLHLYDNSEKVIYRNQLAIGLFNPKKACMKSDESNESITQKRFF